jgi:hypothetical protein
MAPSMNTKSFHQLLHSLPQEIYDPIIDPTLSSPDPSTSLSIIRSITKDYKPPWQLHFNRSVREAFLEVYYRSSVTWTFSSAYILQRWAASLSLKAMYCLHDGKASFMTLTSPQTWRRQWDLVGREQLEKGALYPWILDTVSAGSELGEGMFYFVDRNRWHAALSATRIHGNK